MNQHKKCIIICCILMCSHTSLHSINTLKKIVFDTTGSFLPKQLFAIKAMQKPPLIEPGDLKKNKFSLMANLSVLGGICFTCYAISAPKKFNDHYRIPLRK